jgi:hypothetical protein
MTITLKSKLKDVLKIKGIEDILVKYSFPCISCPMAKMEMDILEIGAICKMYGIDDKKLIKEINDYLKKNKK